MSIARAGKKRIVPAVSKAHPSKTAKGGAASVVIAYPRQEKVGQPPPDEGFTTREEAEARYKQQLVHRASEGFVHSFCLDPFEGMKVSPSDLVPVTFSVYATGKRMESGVAGLAGGV